MLYFISLHLDQNKNESNLTDKWPTMPVPSCKLVSTLKPELEEEGSCLSDPKFNPLFTKPSLFLTQFLIKRLKLPNEVLGKIFSPI